MILNILREGHQAPLSAERLLDWSSADDLDAAIAMLYRLQRLDFVRGSSEQCNQPLEGKLENILEPILEMFSSTGHTLLCDSNGLYLACSQFPHEIAEELSALAVDFGSVYTRHQRLLENNLQLGGRGIAIVPPDGCSDMGFWPLHIGSNTFFLVVEGVPQLNHQAFISMIQLLTLRYGFE